MKILLIDKHPIIRKGMTLILKTHFPDSLVCELDSFQTVDQIPADFKPDLIIFAFDHLNRLYDQRLTKSVKKLYPASKIIIYDDDADYEMVVNCFKTGVDGYVSKKCDMNGLLECINKVLSGNKYATNEALMELMLKQKHLNPVTKARIKKSALSPRELEVANYLSKGMKTTSIAQILTRKVSTISTIKATIFKKLNVDNVVALKEAISAGQPMN
jgi:DNA-binding NarL/FixJ family response regulator